MKKNRQLISFDRPIKRLQGEFRGSRSFLSELSGRDIKIISVPESKSNQNDPEFCQYERISQLNFNEYDIQQNEKQYFIFTCSYL
ncbi:MAG: hypothetical protein LBQ01_09740 [Prevotellaceae bacterium]|jgi:hypothetical protein|nr:hypothetical protein [Prevotellaceae bacterium]